VDTNKGGKMSTPHINCQRAYELRLKYRYQWDAIARICGMANASTTLRSAKRHAAREGLQWPLPGWVCRGEMSYEDRLDGDSWVTIENTLFPGDPYQSKARGYARTWALRNGREWPI